MLIFFINFKLDINKSRLYSSINKFIEDKIDLKNVLVFSLLINSLFLCKSINFKFPDNKIGGPEEPYSVDTV